MKAEAHRAGSMQSAQIDDYEDKEPPNRGFKSPTGYTGAESIIGSSPEEENRGLEEPTSLQYGTPPRVLENIDNQEEVPLPPQDHMGDVI